MMLTHSLVWLRRDLRLHDNAALFNAAAASQKLSVVFVFDTTILQNLHPADRRVAFIWACLQELKTTLQQYGSDLHVRVGNPTLIIPALAQELQCNAVFTNHDIEPQAILRDATVDQNLRAIGKQFTTFKDQTIFEKDNIRTQTGAMYQVFTPYKRAWLAQLSTDDYRSFGTLQDIANKFYHHKTALPFPTLAELGFIDVDIAYLKAGTLGGYALLDDFSKRMHRYHEARDFPGVKGVSYLSTHLRFGTISIRECVRTAINLGALEAQSGAATWLSELIWREFYQQLLWHRPELVTHTFKPQYDNLVFENNRDYFDAWCAGQTGFPIVDAAMRQLNQTGFMHNRLRMIVASFLVKDLLIDWRWGEQYFATHLNDFDLASNNGGWQWAASTGCDAQPYFRIFNPTTQSERFDPNGDFIRRYCPELAHLSAKQIHAPWQNSKSAPSLFNADLNYPKHIVDHSVQRLAALDLFSQKQYPSN